MHIDTDVTKHLQRAANAARVASHVLARLPDAERNAALRAMAAALRSQSADILAANAADLAACGGTPAFRDRLTLTETRVNAMAKGLEDIALLPDPLGRTLADWTRPNGLACSAGNTDRVIGDLQRRMSAPMPRASASSRAMQGSWGRPESVHSGPRSMRRS
jgi:hypothetical protein